MIYKPYKHLVQYYETDQMGIVHHSNYIRWFEEARSYILEENGFGYKKMEELGIISPVLSVNARYKSMTHYYDTVIINVKVVLLNIQWLMKRLVKSDVQVKVSIVSLMHQAVLFH